MIYTKTKSLTDKARTDVENGKGEGGEQTTLLFSSFFFFSFFTKIQIVNEKAWKPKFPNQKAAARFFFSNSENGMLTR
jgi:hypothetical protein